MLLKLPKNCVLFDLNLNKKVQGFFTGNVLNRFRLQPILSRLI